MYEWRILEYNAISTHKTATLGTSWPNNETIRSLLIIKEDEQGTKKKAQVGPRSKLCLSGLGIPGLQNLRCT
jgi:hypothetical protein